MTQRITLTRDWHQLTDGSNDVTIQFTGAVAVCRSSAKPDKNGAGMQFSNTMLTFTKPDVVWVRSSGFSHTSDVVVW
ncbi:hypothetical protein DPU24_00065 [Salmonella enterica subsp. enterica serovar Oranienburg]|nr:hypothetical protein [Salmonella enterica subsp. enterica serovar Oranienburg]EGB0326542.1 hypothetical protein [Salmonella enterica]HEC8369035.1 hypothetical protein [Salmonella enterica subsp. enterica serovar Muenchen]HEC8458365.1 hypothetical protein [Salmonella enterica subsp. enterica serovar Poona]EHK2736805.1 hypothetical protein [Salmonella enterica]